MLITPCFSPLAWNSGIRPQLSNSLVYSFSMSTPPRYLDTDGQSASPPQRYRLLKSSSTSKSINSTNSSPSKSNSLMERLELVRLDGSFVGVQVLQRVLGTVVVGIIVGIDGLSLQSSNGIELLNGCGTKTS